MIQRESAFESRHDFEVEPRFTITRRVLLHRAGNGPIDAIMVNFSRNGFCVEIASPPCAGETVLIELDGWPRLAARVAWSHSDRAGCKLLEPLTADRYEAMILSAEAVNRAGEWSI